MGNASSSQENDDIRRRHMARGKRPVPVPVPVPDYRAKQSHQQSSEKPERTEVPESSSNVSCQEGTPEEGGGTRIESLAFAIRSDLKIECPMVVINNHGSRLRRLSHLSKVPHRMTSVNPGAYMPTIVSIGPYHWGSLSLKGMEVEKRQFLELNLWSRDEKAWNGYVEVVAKLEAEARRYYPDRVNAMDANAFLSMMLLDGFYILGLLYPVSFVRVQSTDAHDSVDVWHDLLLLENQIPFKIVERICEQWAKDAGEDGEIVVAMVREQAAMSIETVLCNLSVPFSIEPSQRPDKFEHLLYLLHTYFKPSNLRNSAVAPDHTPTSRPPNLMNMSRYSVGRVAGRFLYKLSIVFLNWAYNFYNRNRHHRIGSDGGASPQTSHSRLHLHRAVQYYEAGIRFRAKEGSRSHNRHSLLDVTISKDVLEIPRLRVDESAYWLFGNLIAFEQTNASIEKDVTAYIVFMSQLMATEDDVALLSKEGIVQHQLGSNRDVSVLLASLAREVMFDFDSEYHLSPIGEALEDRYRRPRKWRVITTTSCPRRHCRNPWVWIGGLVVFFMFACVMIMTVFTIMAYVRLPDHPKKNEN